ncbi:unnamed protein product [Polarella glacialis]|uniref:Amino acid transporter transmembrane domain-containing protein n=1 Tax=Polarella glacialis TaxID=89957 RepID=A0A813H8H4_POLGL|nr:unnamed protein product [Polarella glacialis]
MAAADEAVDVNQVQPRIQENHLQSSVREKDGSADSDSLGSKDTESHKLFRHGGAVPSAICLSKAALGAGMLSISSHCAEVGLLYTTLALMIGAILTLISIRMISTASIHASCWSYEDICEELFHPAMSLFTGFINVCNCLGSSAGYLIVCGQVFQVLTGASRQMVQLFIVIVGTCICMPLSLAKHVSFMRYLAMISVLALLLVVVVVIVVFGRDGPDQTVDPDTIMFGMAADNSLGSGSMAVFAYMNSFNNVVFAYNNQFNVPQVTGELTPAPGLKRASWVGLISTGLCFSIYLTVSVFGLLAFGVGENQKESLILSLLPAGQDHATDPLLILSLIAVMFSVLTCLQFHIFPVRQFAAYAFRKYRSRDRDEPDVVWAGIPLTRWLDIGSALLAVILVILIAVVVSSLRAILDFVGAFAAAYISYVVPPLWIIQIRRSQPGFSWFSREICGCLAVFALGMFFFLFGTFTAIAGNK